MKKYIVRLSEAERKTCEEVVKKLKGSSQKARRARILLKVDADGPDWCDQQVAPTGFGQWSLRLLAREAVELGICDTISHETVNQTLKKTVWWGATCSTG